MKALHMVLLLVTLTACTATKSPTTTVQRVPAKFDYSPNSRTKVGASGLTIALIKPRFIGDNPEYYVAPFNEMAASMSNDFEELLTAKGFTIRGPFRSRDEMVYNDKTSSDFAFEVNIELNPQYNRKYTSSVNWGSLLNKSASENNYMMTGEVILGGNLIVTASSPQYGEKIWKKNIALDRQTFTYTGKLKWNGVPTMAEELNQDNAVYNTISRELEKFYQQAMALAWQQIEAAEMKSVAEQAKKADKRG